MLSFLEKWLSNYPWNYKLWSVAGRRSASSLLGLKNAFITGINKLNFLKKPEAIIEWTGNVSFAKYESFFWPLNRNFYFDNIIYQLSSIRNIHNDNDTISTRENELIQNFNVNKQNRGLLNFQIKLSCYRA